MKINLKLTNYFADICQVRLDFVNNVLSQPAAGTGLCADTMVVVPGAGTTNPPAICGTNTDQHSKYNSAKIIRHSNRYYFLR